jgi:hypothetical protein
MADTTSAPSGSLCADCGEPAGLVHWGPLVPAGARATLCGACLRKRSDWLNENGEVLPVPASDVYKTGALPVAEEVPMEPPKKRAEWRPKKFA